MPPEPVEAPAPAPPVDLGSDFAVERFSPGRYAAAIQRTTLTRHALQLAREDMTSSIVLNLEPDGTATLCRGWRYQFFNDGPAVHDMEHIREQLGYRGGWEERDGWIHLVLHLDDAICPRVGQYTVLVPNHSAEWRMRCLMVASRGHLTRCGRILACNTPNTVPRFGEDAPHVVAGILPGDWILLGEGNGIRIRSDASSADGRAAVPTVRVEPSMDIVNADAWQQSF